MNDTMMPNASGDMLVMLGLHQNTTDHAMTSLDTASMRLGRRRGAQHNDKMGISPQLNTSRRRRRRRPQNNCATNQTLPLVLGVACMLLLRSPTDAFGIHPRAAYFTKELTGRAAGGRSAKISKRAYHGKLFTTIPPRSRHSPLPTLLRSTLSEDESMPPEAKNNTVGDSTPEVTGSNSTAATGTNTSSVVEEETSVSLNVSEASDVVETTNSTTADIANVSGDVEMTNETLIEARSESPEEEEEEEEEENDERLIQLRQRATVYVAKLPLSQILRRLDKRGLRYGPSSSQEELEVMLVDALVSERSGDGAGDDVVEAGSSRRPRRPTNDADEADEADGDESDEPSYGSRRPSRRQARRRLSNRERRRRRLAQEEPVVTRTIRDVAKAASKVVEPVDRVVSETLWGVVEGDVGNKAKSKVKRVGRKAKRVAVDVAGNVVGGVGDVVDGVKRKGASIRNGNTRVIRVDENGIAEPDWSYVWQEDPDNDVANTNGDEEQRNDYVYRNPSERRGGRKRSRRQRQPTAQRIVDDPSTVEENGESQFTWADYAIPFHTPAGPPKRRSERRRRRNARQQPPSPDFESEDETSESPRAPPSADGNILALPPASMDGESIDSTANDAAETEATASRKRRSRGNARRRNGENRKIYSVYGPSDESSEGDIIDEFGNKIADAAESFLWGDEGEDEPSQTLSRREANARRKRKRRSNRGAATLEDDEGPYEHDLQQKRHWRDRLADRLDAAMGVHEQGSYYQEWADRIEFEEDTKTGEDPEDWVMARHKNQRRMGLTPDERRARQTTRGKTKPKRRGGVDKYFWSQDGNVMSALLGRSRNGNRVVVDDLFNQPLGANVITTLIRSGFQLSLALFTNTCRWASVRGSLPQPIVVFFTGTSLVLAPKGKRLVTAAVTLFALRALAEALHGYIYGPDGWEDDPDHLFIDDDYDDDEFGEQYDGDFEPSPPRNRRRRRRRNSHDKTNTDDGEDDNDVVS